MKTSTAFAITGILCACGGGGGSGGPSAGPAPAQASQSLPAADCTSGTFTLQAQGFSDAPQGVAYYRYCPAEKMAIILLPGLAGESNSTDFSVGPLPDFLVPASIPAQESIVGGFDNSVEVQPLSAEVFVGDQYVHFMLHG